MFPFSSKMYYVLQCIMSAQNQIVKNSGLVGSAINIVSFEVVKIWFCNSLKDEIHSVRQGPPEEVLLYVFSIAQLIANAQISRTHFSIE